MAHELIHRDKRDYDAEDENPQRGSRGEPDKRPFDTSGMNWIPELEENDPPYRYWWVVEEEADRR
jgi:hypothetical protein